MAFGAVLVASWGFLRAPGVLLGAPRGLLRASGMQEGTERQKRAPKTSPWDPSCGKLEAILGAKLAPSWHNVGQNRSHSCLEWHLEQRELSRVICGANILLFGTPLDTKNGAKPLEGC